MNPTTNTAARKKLIQEVTVLVVVIVLIGAVTVLHLGSFGKPAATSTAVQPLDTSFDTNALNVVQQKDKTYPDVTPVSGELGKSDPFAP